MRSGPSDDGRAATPSASTAGEAYARRLETLGSRGIKRYVDVQRPYRWNLRRLDLGRVLDVGCGTGRNLSHLPPGSVGVDHNPHSISSARDRGLDAYTTAEFDAANFPPGSFDSMLVAHVLEHMSEAAGRELFDHYLPFVCDGGRVVVICPQERGYKSDPTHERWVDFSAIRQLAEQVGLAVERSWSFPFPRPIGRMFPYNEFVALLRR